MSDDATAMREDASMHRHEHERETPPRRPIRRSGDEAAATALAARAAAAGRTDALGPASVLRLQRAAGNAGVAGLFDGEAEPESPVKDVVDRGGGVPLAPAVRQRMESSFGTDFSDVRVHSGGGAAASARAVDAHAYTVGNEIVLGDGHAEGSSAHERTLAHELTHVVQQRSGPVEGTPAPGGISVSSPSDRFERAAETTADQVISTGRAADGPGQAAPAIQREAAPEDENQVQELAIQRRDETEEEPEDVPRPEDGPHEVQRPEEGPAQVQRPEEAAGAGTEGPAQAGASEVQRPEEEQDEVQQLAIQRRASRRAGGGAAAGQL
jgi:hypothetical protein